MASNNKGAVAVEINEFLIELLQIGGYFGALSVAWALPSHGFPGF